MFICERVNTLEEYIYKFAFKQSRFHFYCRPAWCTYAMSEFQCMSVVRVCICACTHYFEDVNNAYCHIFFIPFTCLPGIHNHRHTFNQDSFLSTRFFVGSFFFAVVNFTLFQCDHLKVVHQTISRPKCDIFSILDRVFVCIVQ